MEGDPGFLDGLDLKGQIPPIHLLRLDRHLGEWGFGWGFSRGSLSHHNGLFDGRGFFNHNGFFAMMGHLISFRNDGMWRGFFLNHGPFLHACWRLFFPLPGFPPGIEEDDADSNHEDNGPQ